MSRRRGPSPIQEAIRGFLTEHRLGERSQANEVLAAWDDALDPDMRQHASAVRFARGKLTVEVDTSANLHELRAFSGDDVLGRANDTLGTRKIKTVQYKLRG